MVRPPRFRRGSVTVIHEHDGKVVGGNTFAINTPIPKSFDRRS
jgi:hypothetical protein